MNRTSILLTLGLTAVCMTTVVLGMRWVRLYKVMLGELMVNTSWSDSSP